MGRAFTSYKIQDRAYVSFIKREIHNKVSSLSFTAQQIEEIDIIISEITSNLIKHAKAGEILYRVYRDNEVSNFEILCIDCGPGIIDPLKITEGDSTAKEPAGQGLKTLKRLSTLFQIYSIPAWGTILYSLFSTREKPAAARSLVPVLDVEALCVSMPGELHCGDGYRLKQIESGVQIFFGDGLGHGIHAKKALDQAGDFFLDCAERELVEIIRQMHEMVRDTRGLVVSLASFDRSMNEWKLCGVGNIFTRMFSGSSNKTYIAYNGAVGLTIPKTMKASVIPIEKNQRLVMCSDGIRTRWELAPYPAILRNNSLILAAALYKDFARGTDDSSLLIAKVLV